MAAEKVTMAIKLISTIILTTMAHKATEVRSKIKSSSQLNLLLSGTILETRLQKQMQTRTNNCLEIIILVANQ